MLRTPLAMVAVVLMLAAACSGGSEEEFVDGPSAPSPEATEEAPAVPTAEPEADQSAPSATRNQALAFCEASADFQQHLSGLPTAADFTAAFEAANQSYATWVGTVPAELAATAAPLIDGWADVVATFADTADPQATMGSLGALVQTPEYQSAVAEFDAFGNANCVPDTTLDEPEGDAADTPTPETTDEPDTTDEPEAASTDYTGTGGQLAAAGIEFVAEQCDFPEGHLIGADAPDHFAAIAVGGFDIFLAGQVGEEETGLMKFVPADQPSCALVADASFGTGGVLEFEDPINHVSAGEDGSVAASNTIFGTWLVDGSSGASSDCGQGSFAEVSPDGQVGYGHFPGSGELGRYDFSSGCTYERAAVTVASQPNPSSAGWITDDLYVIGGFVPEGGAGVTALDRAGNELWSVGGSPGDIGDLGYGAISAVSGCGGNVCVVDSNFRTMHVLDAADGSQLGLVDLQELTGLRINWFNGLAEDPSTGTLWLSAGFEQVEADGSPSDRVQGLVYRITLR